MNINRSILVGSILVCLTIPVAFAKTYSDTAKCGVLVIDKNIAPNPPPAWLYGTGEGKTPDKACTAAKKDAMSKAPRGTHAKHCDCPPKKQKLNRR